MGDLRKVLASNSRVTMNKVTFAASSIMNQKSTAAVHLSGSSNPSATNNGSGLKTNSSSASTTIGHGAINYNNHGPATAAPTTTTKASISTGASTANSNSSSSRGVVSLKGVGSNRGPGIPPKPSMLNSYRNGLTSADQPVKSQVSIKVNGQSKQQDSETTTASDKSTDSDSPVPPDARAKQVLKEAVNAVVNSFAKHTAQGGYGRGELISPIILIRGQ